MMRYTKSFALMALLSAGPARAETASIPYGKLAGIEAAFVSLPAPQRDKLTLAVAVVHADKTNHAPIRLWVDADGARTDIPATADGDLSLPHRPDWVARDIVVQTDQPKGTLQVGVDMMIRPPAGPVMPARYLLAAVAEADDAMRTGARQMAGYLASLLAPKVHAIGIKLAMCCNGTVTVRDPSGDVVLKQDATGKVLLPLATLQAREGGDVTASATVVSLDPFPN